MLATEHRLVAIVAHGDRYTGWAFTATVSTSRIVVAMAGYCGFE
jgi:hypothetical protein